jgi:lysozyme
MPIPLKISDQGLRLIVEREGSRNEAYRDSVGVWTIGVGHTGPEVVEGLVWSEDQIMEALGDDLATVELVINLNVHVLLEQHQFDALVSFTFNVGAEAFRTSTLLRKINLKEFDEAEDQFDRWHIPPEITSRRNGEKHQFIGDRFEARIPA